MAGKQRSDALLTNQLNEYLLDRILPRSVAPTAISKAGILRKTKKDPEFFQKTKAAYEDTLSAGTISERPMALQPKKVWMGNLHHGRRDLRSRETQKISAVGRRPCTKPRYQSILRRPGSERYHSIDRALRASVRGNEKRDQETCEIILGCKNTVNRMGGQYVFALPEELAADEQVQGRPNQDRAEVPRAAGRPTG